jgi:CII-binding regulator of phage lambda lysogenization HflD
MATSERRRKIENYTESLKDIEPKDIKNFSMSLETACVIEKLQMQLQIMKTNRENMIKRFATLDNENYLSKPLKRDCARYVLSMEHGQQRLIARV